MTDTPCTIRDATDDDAEDLVRLWRILDTPGDAATDEAGARAFLRRAAAYPCYHVYLVLDSAARACATCCLVVIDNPGHGGAPLALVEAVAVDPAQQGRGIGRQLMTHAMDQARAHGCYKLMLSTNLIRAQAHRFYEHLGFVRHGYSYQVNLKTTDDRA